MFFLAVPRPGEDADLRTALPRPGRVVGALLLATVLLIGGLALAGAVAGQVPDLPARTLVLALVLPSLILAGALLRGRLQTRGGLLAALFLIDLWVVGAALQHTPLLPVAAAMAWLALATVVVAMIADRAVHLIQWCGAVLTSAAVVTRGASDVPDAALSLVLLTGGLATAGLLVRHTALRAHTRFAALHRAALTDGLTEVLNRRGLTTAFPALLSRAQRTGRPVGVLVIDIDHFKALNDRHGHDHGDRVLQEVCRIITGAADDGDLVGRIGGEEMVVVTTGSAEQVAHRIRVRLTASAHPEVTVSIGYVDIGSPGLTPATWWSLVADADRGLYAAKRAGRDTVRRGRPGTTRAPVRPASPMIRPQVGRSPGPPAPADPVLLGAPFVLINLAVLGLCLGHRVTPAPVVLAALIGVTVTGALVGTAVAALRAPLPREVLVMGATVTVALALVVAATATDDITRLFALSPLLLAVLVFGLALAPGAARAATAGLAVAAAAIVLTAGPAASATVLILSLSMVVAGELVHLVRRDHETAVLTLQATAVTDPLTGLANRRGLDQAFARARPGDTVTVVALDVDDFKAINDRHGHVGGDAALIDLARVLGTVTDGRTTVGRSGGDEFVVVSTAQPSLVLDRVRAASGTLPAGMTVSIGINQAVVGDVGTPSSLWPLVARADVGLLAAKRDRRRSGLSRHRSTAAG